MTVTEIAAMDSKRRRIYIDGEYAFFLYPSELRRYNIEEGMQLEEKVFDELNQVVVPKRVKARTLYILKAAMKTEKQLYDKLMEGGYSREHAAVGIEYAKSFGYINDLEYARCFVGSSCRGRSRRDVEARLYKRGIGRDIIEQVLDEVPVDEDEAIYAALQKKSVRPENIQSLGYEVRSKLYIYLLRRGFSSSGINRVLRTFG